jgi:hypothetical protein
MTRPSTAADDRRVSFRVVVSLLAGAAVAAAFVGQSGTATAGRASCAQGKRGYTYAGHQAARRGHGVRATISATHALRVEAGHVSGWVGVGGPGQGANGEDAWIQVGMAAMHGVEQPFLYAEVARGGSHPQFILLENEVRAGERRDLAVLEVSRRPGWWQVWVDGTPATKPTQIRGSSGRWAPIATAESWSGGKGACNRFAYRFERVSVAQRSGGSWKPFVSGYRFLDHGYELRTLSTGSGGHDAYARRLSGSSRAPLPYAFVAAS